VPGAGRGILGGRARLDDTDLCAALAAQPQVRESARVLEGDVFLIRPGLAMPDGASIADGAVKAGGAEAAEPRIVFPALAGCRRPAS
jgi:hypothetical protein